MSELPLLASWERQAAKSLAQALYLLAHGQFVSSDDLANWLRAEADSLAVITESESQAQQIFRDIMEGLTGKPSAGLPALPSPDESA